MTFVSNINFG